jgi:Kef-type K+ transport system membrane component KefB
MFQFFNVLLQVEVYQVLFPIALILIISKGLGVFAKRLGLPQILTMLLTGIIMGLLALVPWINNYFITEDGKEGVKFIAELGVVLILFSAGLGTDLKQVKASGFSALIITILDVVLSLVLGFVASGLFFGFGGTREIIPGVVVKAVWSNIFYGVILSATSVSVTVATLRELGKLNSKIGTTIVSAAILDDIVGVIILSVILSLSGAGATGSQTTITTKPFNLFFNLFMPQTLSQIMTVILQTILFFAFIFVLGVVVRKIFTHLENKYPHHRRIPIYGLAFCFLVAFLSQELFGMADITGAYFAGLILSGRSSTKYVERRTDIASYIIFTPVFFANIGMSTNWKAFTDPSFISFMGFGFVFLLCSILGKGIGATAGSLMTKNNLKDSLRCGMSMVVRAEVCLVSAQKGIDAGLVDDRIKIFLIILIVASSIIVPILLKFSYKDEKVGFVERMKDNPEFNEIHKDQELLLSKTHDVLVEENLNESKQ